MAEIRRSDRLDFAAAAASSVAFVAISAAYYGYTFGQSANHAFYLPGVLSRLDPGLFKGDPAVAALASVPTYFWRMFAGVAGTAGLERAAWTLWLLSRFLAGLATYKTARLLGGNRTAGVLSVFLAAVSWELFAYSPLAGDPMLKPFLDQTSFAWPLILGAVALWLSGRRSLSLLALGLIADINVLLATSVACWLVTSAILAKPARSKDIAAGAALFLLAACPVLIHFFQKGMAGDIELMLICTPQTYLCSVWPWEKWLGAAVQLSFWTSMLALHPRAKDLMPLLYSALILWTATALAGLWLPLHRFLSLQFFRLDVAVCWLALTATGTVLCARFGERRPARFLPAVTAVWSFGCPIGGGALTAWGTGMLLSQGNRAARLALGLAGILYGLLAVYRPVGSLLYLPLSAAMTVILWAALAIALDKASALSARAHAGILLLAASLALQPLVAISKLRAGRPDEPAPDEAELWARGTAPDSLFIVPPDWSGFRLRSRRPVYAEWADFNLANWDEASALAWKTRMEDLGVDWNELAGRRAVSAKLREASLIRRAPFLRRDDFHEWGMADSERLVVLARRAHARYLAAPTSVVLPWAQAFRSSQTTVYLAP